MSSRRNTDAPFSSQRASKLFQDCCSNEDGSIFCINTYVGGFFELVKMFNLLGRVFSFVVILMSRDLNILLNFQQGANGNHYRTLQTMMSFEQASGDPKGCKIFRRFHYTLEFISQMLERLKDVGPEEGLAETTFVGIQSPALRFDLI